MPDSTATNCQPSFPPYFANAAAGLMSPEVTEATIGHLRREAEIGAPLAAAEASDTLAEGYAAAARLIGATIEEVAFVESGNRALAALIQSAGLQPGDHILVDRTCWGGTLNMLASYPEVIVDVMPVDRHGRADPEAARHRADPRTKLILLTWCPSTCGIINPAAEIGMLASELGAFYIVDACQVLGQRPVDVVELDCHGLAASGRKWLRGPRGTALLYASQDYLGATQAFMPDQFGQPRADARRYETGETFVAGRIGLSVAIRIALETGVDAIAMRLAGVAGQLREQLSTLPGVTIIERGTDLAAFVTIDIAGVPTDRAVRHLARQGIVVSSLGRSYAPLDMDARGLTSVMRIAPHLFTEQADVELLINAVRGFGNKPPL